MILGCGIDVVEIALFEKIFSDPTSVFKIRHFTEREMAYCEGQPGHNPLLHYAGRYAAKEAFIKALGPLYRDRAPDITAFDYHNIEVVSHPVAGPSLSISGKLASAIALFNIHHIFVSISHEAATAVAMVILEN